MSEVEIFLDFINSTHKKIADAFINLAKYDAMPRCVWDFDENFVFVNEKFASCFGYTQEEMKGKPFTNFIFKEDIGKSIEIYTRNTNKDSITVMEGFTNRYVHKDGSIVTVLWLKGFNDFENRIGSGQIEIIK